MKTRFFIFIVIALLLMVMMLLLTGGEIVCAIEDGMDGTSAEPSGSESGTGDVRLEIDDAHRYKGMDKAYSKGYVPAVKQGKATILLPLIASGELEGDAITAVPQLGDPSSSPFVYKNYQITVRKKDNPVNNGKSTVSSYLVAFRLPLKSKRENGTYPVTIDIKGREAAGGEVLRSFTAYITITDAKPAADEAPVDGEQPMTPNEPASGAGEAEEKPTSQPKVIVSGYQVKPTAVIAGKKFTVTVTLKNTNEKKAVQNMTVDVSCDSPCLTFLNDSGTIFISKLDKGATKEIELVYRTDMETPAQKYNIALALS